MDKVTLKIKKSHLIIGVLILIFIITAFFVAGIYREYVNSLPPALDDPESIELIQLEAPSEGAVKAHISTDLGDMTAVIYDEITPAAAALFSDTAKNGGYDGLAVGLYELGTVFSIDAPEPSEPVPTELSDDLWPFKGALCMTEKGDIIFINTVEFTDEDREYLSSEGELYELRSAFLEHGGVPDYSRCYTVFGQVIEGVDVLEKIALSPAESSIVINSISIEE